MAEVRRKQAYYYERGVRTENLDENALRKAEPNLCHGLPGGLLVPGDSVLYQLGATSFLIERAKQDGAHVIVGKKVVEISDQGLTLSDGDFVAAGSVINAAGTAAVSLSPELKIVARKGHLAITERYPNFVSHQLIELGYLRSAHGDHADSVAFNVQPRMTGQIILGSSRQFGAESSEIDRDILRRMTSRAFEYMPALRSLSTLRIWTGFRPATPDNLPYIGRLPGYENIYVAAGHEGLGITTSLGTGKMIADLILGRGPEIPYAPYSPGREIKEH